METLPVRVRRPSPYERGALREIQQWRTPRRGWVSTVVRRVNHTVHQATDLLRKVPGVDWTIENVVAGLLRLTNEIVQDSVWRDAIHKEYCQAGFPLEGRQDIWQLDLEDVDRVARDLRLKYRTLAAVEGAAVGYAGAAGVVADVLALVALNLRAIGEYATYCGFDLADDAERLYALHLLNMTSEDGDKAKQLTFAPVVRTTRRLAREQAALAMEQFALTRALTNATRTLAIRLTRAKLAQILPVTGAAVASGFNAYYTSRVCDAARHLYRERFLIQKYGVSALATLA